MPFLLLVLCLTQLPDDSLKSLESYRWEKRPLILFAPDMEHTALKGQLNLFKEKEEELGERDVLLLLCVGPSRHPVLRKHFRVKPDGFTAILIGKDGGEKWRTQKPFPVMELTRRIDVMPMGREEAEKRKIQKDKQ